MCVTHSRCFITKAAVVAPSLGSAGWWPGEGLLVGYPVGDLAAQITESARGPFRAVVDKAVFAGVATTLATVCTLAATVTMVTADAAGSAPSTTIARRAPTTRPITLRRDR